MTYKVNDLSELPEVAKALLEFAGEQRVFLFYGDMGAGKTTFIKALCEELQIKDLTSSPTFSIVNEYQSLNGPVYHFDFYRLKTETEAFDMGYEDYIYSGDYCFIEWPEKISNLLPVRHVKITIEVSETGRRIIAEIHR